MGQGAESCGGYEVDFDPYEDGLSDGIWTMRDGSQISVEKMTTRNLQNAKRIAEAKAECATFTDEARMWNEWVELFDRAISARGDSQDRPAIYTGPEMVKPTRGTKTTMRCHCGAEYQARTADLKRGWALSCSKRCASIRRDYGSPAAKEVKK